MTRVVICTFSPSKAQGVAWEDIGVSIGDFAPFATRRVESGRMAIMDPKAFVEWAFSTPYCDELWAARLHASPMTAATCAESLARLGNEPRVLDATSDDQLACGLKYLLHGEYSDFAYLIRDGDMTLELRQRAIDGIGALLLQQVDRRLGAESLERSTCERSELSRTIYMLWDVSPLSFWPPSPHADHCRSAFIAMLERVLHTAHSLGLRESVLHGLGHMCHAAPDQVSGAISRWLAGSPVVPAWLVDYARNAATGSIQ